MLSFFKFKFCNSVFIINNLKTTFNTGQKDCIYREVLKGSCYIKILKILQATPNCLGNVSIANIKETGKCFTYIC